MKEEMQVNLMMIISMTPRELHLMYNFMTLYITVINLLVQNNVFNFLGGLKVRHSVPGDCLSVCNLFCLNFSLVCCKFFIYI